MNELGWHLGPRYVPTKFDHNRGRNAPDSSNGISRSKWLISSLSTHLMDHVSHERTRSRPWSKVRSHQVWPRSEKNCTWESSNRLSRSKWLISSLIIHLSSQISHEWTRSRSWPKVRPYHVWLKSEMNCTRESGNGLSRSKWLIIAR